VTSAFGAGFVFGIGLWLSGMANPRKVLDFLDISGNWDPSLILVMGGAVAVTAIAFRPLLRKQRMDFKTRIDAPLALSTLSADFFVFVAAMVGGGLFARIVPSARPGA
jgi:uncharacterized protein